MASAHHAAAPPTTPDFKLWATIYSLVQGTTRELNELAGETVVSIQRHGSMMTVSSSWGAFVSVQLLPANVIRLKVGRRNGDGYDLLQPSDDVEALQKRITMALVLPSQRSRNEQ